MATLKDNVTEIKDFLKKNGGLYITNRQVGKSEALIQLLHETKDSYILTFNASAENLLKDRYKKKYKDGKEKFITCNPGKFCIADCFIDEYFFHRELYAKFRGAVSTMKFPVKTKKLKSNIESRNASLKKSLGDIQYKKEIT